MGWLWQLHYKIVYDGQLEMTNKIIIEKVDSGHNSDIPVHLINDRLSQG